MNDAQNTVIAFDTDFNDIYVSTWMKAIKTNKIKHLYVYVAKDNTLRYIINGENDNANIANLDLIIHLYFDYREFSNIPIDLNTLVQFLSSEEKSEYIKKQNVLLEDDTWLFYDVRKMMIHWIRDTYPSKFDSYVMSVIEDRLKVFRDAYFFKEAKERLAQIAMTNYNSANSSKKRDILKEVEHERDELCDKITKLEKFISGSDVFKTLPAVEQTAMRSQLFAMNSYADALLNRITIIASKEKKNESKSRTNNKK